VLSLAARSRSRTPSESPVDSCLTTTRGGTLCREGLTLGALATSLLNGQRSPNFGGGQTNLVAPLHPHVSL
jgi:hypothetical protein